MFDLSINNFRGFRNQHFKFSRINILIGENSSGKSSLLKFFLALKQTIDNPFESNLKLIGDYTDLGNYQQIIYNNNSNLPLQFTISDYNDYIKFYKKRLNELKNFNLNTLYDLDELEDESNLNLLNDIDSNPLHFLSKIKNSKTSATFNLTNKLSEHSSITTIIENSRIGSIKIIPPSTNQKRKRRTCDIIIKLDAEEITLKNIKYNYDGFILHLIIPMLKEEFKRQKLLNNTLYIKTLFLIYFQNYISVYFTNISFVNPMQNIPKRFYVQEDKKRSYELINIEKLVNILGDKNISAKKKQQLMDSLNNAVKVFGIAEEIRIQTSEDFPVLTLEVKIKGTWANITDVGHGVALQLPIIFQAVLSEFYSPDNETILIEQPELHLHPSLHAKFIETLISIGNKNSYFIETHSEHIIRKLQVLVKNKFNNLSAEDITIHYFKKDNEGFQISEHKILENGKLSSPFPSGFFDTSYNLTKELF